MPNNQALLEDAAAKLKGLLDEVVFVGGSTLELMITDAGAAPVRGTVDVDVIAEITTYADYVVFSDRLRTLGFREEYVRTPHSAVGYTAISRSMSWPSIKRS